MPGPTLIFGFILATLFGAVFHLVFGGDARRLALFLLAGWAGFGMGHVLGVILDINFLNIGTLRVLSASVSALVVLTLVLIVTVKRPRKRLQR